MNFPFTVFLHEVMRIDFYGLAIHVTCVYRTLNIEFEEVQSNDYHFLRVYTVYTETIT